MSVAIYVIAATEADAYAYAEELGYGPGTAQAVTDPRDLRGVRGRTSKLAIAPSGQQNELYRAILVEAARCQFDGTPPPRGGFSDAELDYVLGRRKQHPATLPARGKKRKSEGGEEPQEQ